MKIAVACDGLAIAPHAASCSSFTCYTINSGVIVSCSNVPNLGLSPRERAQFLRDMGVDALLARQFSDEGLAALGGTGIEPILTGATTPREAVEAHLRATLMGDTGIAGESIQDEPLDDLDDAFARIEFKLVAQAV